MFADWYPLCFTPIHESHPWGGQYLRTLPARPAIGPDDTVGISWELVDQGGRSNTCENGPLAGRTLRDLIASYPEEMIGSRQRGDMPCPLKLRFYDVARQLPLQVHTADVQGQPIAKTWYVIRTRPGARIQVGMSRRGTQQQFMARYGSPQLGGQVEQFPASVGDAYYITPGRVHAIGSGNLVFAVEQSTDDSHVVGLLEGVDADTAPDPEVLRQIDFTDRSIARIRADGGPTLRNRKVPLITNCPAYSVDELRLTEKLFDRGDMRSFHYIHVVAGPVIVEAGGVAIALETGRGCLLPAALTGYSVAPMDARATVLRIALRS